MIISVVYLLVRCLLGCLTVLTRRTQREHDIRKNDRHLRREVLDRLLIVNEHHLRRAGRKQHGQQLLGRKGTQAQSVRAVWS